MHLQEHSNKIFVFSKHRKYLDPFKNLPGIFFNHWQGHHHHPTENIKHDNFLDKYHENISKKFLTCSKISSINCKLPLIRIPE